MEPESDHRSAPPDSSTAVWKKKKKDLRGQAEQQPAIQTPLTAGNLSTITGDRCDFEGTWIETENSLWAAGGEFSFCYFFFFVPTVGPATSHADKPWRKL